MTWSFYSLRRKMRYQNVDEKIPQMFVSYYVTMKINDTWTSYTSWLWVKLLTVNITLITSYITAAFHQSICFQHSCRPHHWLTNLKVPLPFSTKHTSLPPFSHLNRKNKTQEIMRVTQVLQYLYSIALWNYLNSSIIWQNKDEESLQNWTQQVRRLPTKAAQLNVN